MNGFAIVATTFRYFRAVAIISGTWPDIITTGIRAVHLILQESLANLVSAQIGQAVIEQNQVGHRHLSAADTFASRESRDNLQSRIRRGQRVFHENQQHLGIIDDDDFLPGFRRWRFRGLRTVPEEATRMPASSTEASSFGAELRGKRGARDRE